MAKSKPSYKSYMLMQFLILFLLGLGAIGMIVLVVMNA